MQVQELASQMRANPALVEQVRADPAGAIGTIADASPLSSDKTVYRIVVGSLGMTVLIAIAGALVLSFYGKTTPDVVTALGSAAVGALAGLLAPVPSRS